ncbi:MAG: hypothetical protein K2G70_01535 [Turicibacter sp.]|nr:hypothetical protein [Turicibacter sp.]
MKEIDYRRILIEGFIHLIFDIIKDMVAAMPLGLVLVALTILMYFVFLIILYNKFKKNK